jgi:hypothetical protein
MPDPKDRKQMLSNDQYYAAVARLNLKPTKVPHVYAGPDGTVYNVPDASQYSSLERAAIIDRLTVQVTGF